MLYTFVCQCRFEVPAKYIWFLSAVHWLHLGIKYRFGEIYQNEEWPNAMVRLSIKLTLDLYIRSLYHSCISFNLYIYICFNWMFDLFSPAVCESCIEPIPLCNEGEILTVDLSSTHYCCPRYHCGKISWVNMTSSIIIQLLLQLPVWDLATLNLLRFY